MGGLYVFLIDTWVILRLQTLDLAASEQLCSPLLLELVQLPALVEIEKAVRLQQLPQVNSISVAADNDGLAKWRLPALVWQVRRIVHRQKVVALDIE